MISKTLFGRLAVSLALVILFASQACAVGVHHSGKNKTDAAMGSNTASPTQSQLESPTVEDQILVAVSNAIRKARLTDRPDECLAYRFDFTTSREAYFVEVRENHQHANCGGDPLTQPRLFTVRVDRKTRKMFTDQGSPGNFMLLGREAHCFTR